MGTRCTVKFIQKLNGEEKPLVNVFFQFDGYPEGVGAELCRWLIHKKIVNGIPDFSDRRKANGFGCLAAQYIRDMKMATGSVYIVPCDYDPQDYNYEVICDVGKVLELSSDGVGADELITVRVNVSGKEPFFTGSPLDLLMYMKEHWDE